MKEKVEYKGQNCYIPTSGLCFIECINYFTNKDYTEEFRDFIRNEKYLSDVMICARIQPFCKKNGMNIGCFDGKRINLRKLTERKISLFSYNFHFCFLRKSNTISFNQAIEELKVNFIVIDFIISDKHVKSFVKYY